MFKKVIATPGFWKSVFALAIAFAVLFTIIKWAIEGFTLSYFTENNPLVFFLVLIAASFIYGFFVTFGKFKARIKENELRK